MNSARSVVPGGTADTSGSASRRDLRRDDLARLLDRALAERHVALDARQLRAVVGDVEQPRLDLAARRRGRGGRRRAAPAVVPSSRGRPARQPRRSSREQRATATTRPAAAMTTHPARRSSRASGRGRVAEPDDGVVAPPARAAFWNASLGEQLFLLRVASGSPSRSAPPACSPIRAREAARARSAGAASGTRSRSCSSSMPAKAADRSRWRVCARSHEHELDVARAAAEGRHALGAAGGRVRRPRHVERGVEDRRAGRRSPQRRVGVQADEQVGLVVVRDRGALVERHVAVVVARQQHADAEPRFDARPSRGARPPASGLSPSRRSRP